MVNSLKGTPNVKYACKSRTFIVQLQGASPHRLLGPHCEAKPPDPHLGSRSHAHHDRIAYRHLLWDPLSTVLDEMETTFGLCEKWLVNFWKSHVSLLAAKCDNRQSSFDSQKQRPQLRYALGNTKLTCARHEQRSL